LNPREIIKVAVDEETYTITQHGLTEMDKDVISIEQVESVMKLGTIVKRDKQKNRYTLKAMGIMISIELNASSLTIVTVGRERR